MDLPPPMITLLTDFGEKDAFVGIMKGVILGIAPKTQLVDLSHSVPPQDIKEAAYLLLTAVRFFPVGTIHLIVVDPGVGSARRPIAVKTNRATYVAPDNGVLSYVLADAESFNAVELTNPAYRLPEVSTTFHGRDVFSPAAAHLAAGVPLAELGPSVADLVPLPLPHLSIEKERISAEVLSLDHFGNIRTSLLTLRWESEETLSLHPLFGGEPGGYQGRRFRAAATQIRLGELTINGISQTFSDVPPGEVVAYVGSEGGLELAINQGNLARKFNVRSGEPIEVILGK